MHPPAGGADTASCLQGARSGFRAGGGEPEVRGARGRCGSGGREVRAAGGGPHDHPNPPAEPAPEAEKGARAREAGPRAGAARRRDWLGLAAGGDPAGSSGAAGAAPVASEARVDAPVSPASAPPGWRVWSPPGQRGVPGSGAGWVGAGTPVLAGRPAFPAERGLCARGPEPQALAVSPVRFPGSV